LNPELARQMSTLMDTLATCTSIIQAAGVGNDATPAVTSGGTLFQYIVTCEK
jgi:hypothetical protein